jgi:pimeloyl-ACP methyl ester carboxylesterase
MKTIATALLVVLLAIRPAPAQDSAASAAAVRKPVATVKSKDGTPIAYERSGSGPPLVLVAGALSDRSGARELAKLLAPTFTVVSYDRRGRGDSGDTQPYAVQREVEDIEALIDDTGGPVFLFGSSSGAALALEATTRLPAKVGAAVLFEPPFIVDDSRAPIPEQFFRAVDALVTAGRRDDAVAQFMTKGIGVPDEMVADLKQAPMWPAMVKLAHTLPYDGAVMAGTQSGKPLPAERWKAVRARTLVIDGERSDPFLRNAVAALVKVLPGSTRHTLAGQDHSAAFTAPDSLVPVLVEFLRAGQGGQQAGKKLEAAK